MMQIGIMARHIERPTLEETLDAIAAHGIRHLQFGLASAGLPDLPDEVPADLCERIRGALDARGMEIAALSGTFNMIDPDVEKRRDGLRRLRALANACERLGTSVITLCTGTRDPVSMWRRHPDNDTPEAWDDMVESVGEAAAMAEAANVTLAFEPEVSNVVDSAVKARFLLDEIGSTNLKVCIDGANLFHAGELPQMTRILEEAFQLLGNDIALAHAKDLSRDGEAGHDAAGTGLLDYDRYLSLLKGIGYKGAIILHSLKESQVEQCAAFLRQKIDKL